MVGNDLRQERLVQPFAIEVSVGHYRLTQLKSRLMSAAMREFRQWLLNADAVVS